MEYLFFAFVLGFIPAMIAKSKGHSFGLWYIYGVALFIIALVHAILLKGNREVIEERAVTAGSDKKCPYCAELIRAEAVVCRFCGKDQPVAENAICKRCGKGGVYYDVYNKLFCPHCNAPASSGGSSGFLNE